MWNHADVHHPSSPWQLNLDRAALQGRHDPDPEVLREEERVDILPVPL